jgi:WD40 repeat protein
MAVSSKRSDGDRPDGRTALSALILLVGLGTPLRAYQEPDRVAKELSFSKQRSGPVGIAVSADGERVAWAGATGALFVAKSNSVSDHQPVGLNSDARVRSIAWSPDGHTVAAGTVQPTRGIPTSAVGANRPTEIVLTDLRSRTEAAIESSDWFDAYRLAFSSGGKLLASTTRGGIAVWDVGSRLKRCQLEYRGRLVQCMSFSPDESVLAAGDDAGQLALWDLARAQRLHLGKAHDRVVTCVRFSPDGSAIATGSLDHYVAIWDTAARARVVSLHDERGGNSIDRVHAIAFAADGRSVVSAHSDGVVRVWDLPARHLKLRIRLRLPSDVTLRESALSADGRIIAVVVDSGMRDVAGEASHWVYTFGI